MKSLAHFLRDVAHATHPLRALDRWLTARCEERMWEQEMAR